MTETFNNISENIADKVELFSFLKKKAGFKLKNVIFVGAVGGLANAMILVAIATAVYNLYTGESNTQLFLTFILLLTLMVLTQRVLYRRWVAQLEGAVEKTRNELCEKLTVTDLKALENLDKGEVYNRLTQEMANISQFGVYLIKGIQGVFIVIFISFYILQIFAPALIIIAGLILTAALIYLTIINKVYSKYEELNKKEINYFNWIGDVLYGSKEIKLNSSRREHIQSAGEKISEELKETKLKIGAHYNKSVVFTNAFFYFLFGAVLFVIPALFEVNTDTMLVLTAVTIYLTDPISNIVMVVPLFQKVALSISFIGHLENSLNNSAEEDDIKNKIASFNKIEVKDAVYRYTIEEDEFLLGPVSLEINRGEITFVTGGNGSGKTTLLKILLSFYKPEEGVVLLDGEDVSAKQKDYREMFSCIFSDFHLFEKAYGINPNLLPIVNENLKQFNLHNRVKLNGNKFSTINLSTGQKKRLALAIALAEEKDIYILDEWAAEQDPEYRDYFYNSLLHELKARGKTLIVVSHDGRYFNVADKIIRMDYGKINSVKIKK